MERDLNLYPPRTIWWQTIGSLYSDSALREYALWAGGLGPGGEGVLKYAYDASRSGSKMQSTPLRSAHEWVLRGRAQQGEELLLVEPQPVPVAVILVGVMLGWIIRDAQKK